MPSPFEPLSRDRYDLLVVGGGIHGLFAAYDAASRGLHVALVERGDFGSGLSFNHQRTIHGGLRALQTGNLAKTREQIAERRAWARMAPHLLRPLPFLMGTYRWTKRSRWVFRAGFAAYDLLGRYRNVDVPPELHLPRAKLESRAATRRLFPGIAPQALTGGAVWYDYQTRHPDRLTWTVALAAMRVGAHLANYVEAVGALSTNGTITGARVRAATGEEREIQASCTLLAAGGDIAAVQRLFGVSAAPPMLRAMNVLLAVPARDIALVAPAPSGRMLTAVPWSGRVLVGTHQSEATVDSGAKMQNHAALDECLAEIQATFPQLHAYRSRVSFVHCGMTPAVARHGRPELQPEARIIRHGRHGRHGSAGASGLVSLIGVKYTTARHAAERAIDAVMAELHKPKGRCRTAAAALPHAGIADVEGRLLETLRDIGITLDRDVVEHLSGWYGTEASDVARHAGERGLVARVAPDTPILEGELTYAVQQAQARRLSDVVLRRTPLGSAGHPGGAALTRAAAILASELGWSPEQTDAEIQDVERVYPQPSEPPALKDRPPH